jgi:ferredoxin
VPLEAPAAVIFGVRPCDAKALTIMDRHFLGCDVVDPYWQARRDKAVVVGYAYDPAQPRHPADFSERLGIQATDREGSDVLMVRQGGSLYLEAVTPKGEALLAASPSLTEATPQDEVAYGAALQAGQKGLQDRIEDGIAKTKLTALFEKKEFWEEAAAACLGCGICTFVCPNCYCFDIHDETLFQEGARKRFWDACLFTDFTLEASGHNPRPRIFQRYRQKVMHKYAYHVTRYGCISCVGCGRCTRACPVNIHILAIVDKALQQ